MAPDMIGYPLHRDVPGGLSDRDSTIARYANRAPVAIPPHPDRCAHHPMILRHLPYLPFAYCGTCGSIRQLAPATLIRPASSPFVIPRPTLMPSDSATLRGAGAGR